MAGTAGATGESLVSCVGWVGGDGPYPLVTAAVGQPVYVQVPAGVHFRLTASPARNAQINNLRVTPVRAALTTVWVTGALCAPQPLPSGPQPKTCVLLQIKSH
jgi:hypothetical protein